MAKRKAEVIAPEFHCTPRIPEDKATLKEYRALQAQATESANFMIYNIQMGLISAARAENQRLGLILERIHQCLSKSPGTSGKKS